MKLHFAPHACSLAPHIVLRELALPFDLVLVDNKAKTTANGENFLHINPKGYVAALQLDNGQVLTEASAILQYLADLKPAAGLAPANGSWERVRLQEWLNFLSTEVHKGFIPLLYAAQAGKYVELAKPKLEQRYAWIDQQLAGKPYLMGEHFSVADAYLFALTGWGQAPWLTSYYKADIHFDQLDHLRDWYLCMLTRPAVRQALREEGLI